MINANVNNNVRKEVYRRDGYRCALCDSTRYLQIHHCVPRGQGGSNNPKNLVTLCSTCHAQVHGFHDLGGGLTPEDLSQAIVEYLADHYAPNWCFWEE